MTPSLKPVPTVKNPGTAAAYIAVASSQVGFREGFNNNTPYGAWYGLNNVAWCAIFQSWVAAHSGAEGIVPKHAYTPSGAAWFKSKGQWGHSPKVGALAYFYSASQGRIHHVAVVAKVNSDGTFITVEGNTNDNGSATGNGVYMLRRSGVGGSNGGFGYPKFREPPVVVVEGTHKPATRETKLKDTGDDVKFLQRYFGQTQTGTFDTKLQTRLHNWQMSMDLPATGTANTKTWNLFKKVVKGL